MRSRASSLIRETLPLGLLLAVLLGPPAGANSDDDTLIATPAPTPSTIVLEQVIDERSLEKSGGKLLRWITGASVSRPMERPHGVAWDGDDLIVTDPGAGRVFRIARKGKVSWSPDAAFETPIGIAVCSGEIVVTDARSGRVVLLNRKLRPVRDLATGLQRPTGIACAGGRVFVVETALHRVVAFDTASKAVAEPVVVQGGRGNGPGEFNFPAAIFWHRGSLWVGDTLNFRVQRFEGVRAEFKGEFGHLGDAPGEMPRIKGVALDGQGHLWITDAHLNQIGLYAQDGRFLMHLGGTGNGPGQFSFPAGMAVHDDGRVVVVDSLNRRLQIFRVEMPKPGGSG